MKKISILLVLLIGSYFLYAQDIAYYKNQGLEGKSQGALKTALHTLISPHTNVGYDGLYNVYKTSDDLNGKVYDMYSTCTFTHVTDKDAGSHPNICDSYNREHIVPQSWFDKKSPMVSDAFHIYPTDSKVNEMRSNNPHGETNAAPIGGKGLGKLGACSVAGYTGTVYEPIDEYKGDIARTYFYFVTCYEDKLSQFNGTVLTKVAYPGLTKWFLDLMLKWHRQDPVSQKEIDRNNAVYVHQKNRNPYIDYPALAEHVWGAKKDEPFSFSSTPIEGGGAGGGTTPDPTPGGIVITVSGQTIDIQGLQKTELIQVVDGTGSVVYEATTTCTNHMITVPHAGQYKVKIDGTLTGGTLDIK